MASTTSLKLGFETAYGTKTWTFKYIDPQSSTQNIKTLMDTMITNGSIYKYPPLARASAELVTTTSTGIDVS